MSYQYNNDKQKQAILGSIASLMNELQTLAPHPDMKSYKGPLFLKNNANLKASNDQDAMLGSMMMEAIVGVALTEAMSEMSDLAPDFLNNIDVNNVMECYSEYITEIEGNAQKIAAHGQGTLARLSGSPISNSFNMRSDIEPGLQAFYEDLPQRMTIEKSLAYYAKQLDMLSLEHAAPQYAAPAPRFAA